MGERYIRVTNLQQLAEAARQQLLKPTRLEPAFVPAHPAVRLAAGAADVAIAMSLGLASSCLVFGFFLIVLGQDFDGPPQYDAVADWLFFSCVALTMLLYGVVEAFGARTIGKRMLGLRVVSTADPPRKRTYAKRWALKSSPFIVLALVCVWGFAHTEWLGWERFDDEGWAAGWEVLVAFTVPAMFVLGGFLCSFRSGGLATYDRITDTLVVRPVYLHNPSGRGFDVIPTATLAGVPAGLATPRADGYAPAADDE